MYAASTVQAYDQAQVSLAPEVIYRDGAPSATDIAETVRRWGIIVFPGFVKGAALARINAEFDAMIATRRDLGFHLDEYQNIVNIRVVRPKLDPARFPETAGFFQSPLMSEVADAYFGAGQYRLNGEIFVSNLEETKGAQTAPPFALHFDKRQVLKFFVYLTDTDARNGAMRVLPGSNLRNRAARELAMSRGAINDIPNILPEPGTPSMPVTGPAGTMFVFDTDMCHGASAVQAGLTRRTMRGHTHSQSMLTAMGVH